MNGRMSFPPGFFTELDLGSGLTEIEQLRLRTRFLEERLDALAREEPMALATVTDVRDNGPAGSLVVLTFPDGDVEAPVPKGAKGITLGRTVRVLRKNRQIVGPVDLDQVGLVAEVHEILPNGFLLVEHASNKRAIRPCAVTAKPGERVLMDFQGRFATRAIGPAPVPTQGLAAEVLEVLAGGLLLVEHAHNRRSIEARGIEAKQGERVLMDPQGKFAIRNLGRAKPPPAATGELAEVLSRLSDEEIEVKYDARRAILRLAPGAGNASKGDRVVMDRLITTALRVLPGAASSLLVQAETGVEWSDVQGQDAAVRILRAAIERPAEHPEVLKKFRKKRPRGVCIHGPSGTGKTLIGRASATAQAKAYSKHLAPTGFVYVKGPELKDKWFGGAEERVRALFAGARDHFARHGYPQILFIDEAEAILMSRHLRQSGANVDVSIVQMFLAEMDGFEDTGAFLILATNRPQDIDPAILRKGRIDRKVLMGRPTKEGAAEILVRHLRARPLPIAASHVAKSIVEDLWNPHLILFTLRCQDGRNDRRITLADTVSGAMLEGLVESAVDVAIERCIASPEEEAMMTPLDFRTAVREAYREAYEVGASEVVGEALATLKDFRTLERARVDFNALPPLTSGGEA